MEVYGTGAHSYLCMPDEEVVQLAQRGTSDAAEFIICRYRALVENKARAYYLLGADRDDVIQEGMIGLCKAIRDFRDDRLSKFKPFAELCVTRQIITAVKTATRQKHAPLNASVSLDQSLSPDMADGSLLDLVPSAAVVNGDRLLERSRLPQNLAELVQNVLSDLERSVLARYLDGQSYREISLDLQCHTKSIDNALQRVKKKIGTLLQSGAG